MSATRTLPQCSRPGSSRWPGLRRKNVTLSAALHRRAHHGAARAVDAARQVDRDDRRAARVHRLDQRARLARRPARSSPAPNSASTMTPAPGDALRRAPARSPVPARAPPRPHRPSAPPRSPSSISAHRVAALGQQRAPRRSRRRHCCPGPPRPATRGAERMARDRVGDRAPGLLHQRRCRAMPPAIARRSPRPFRRASEARSSRSPPGQASATSQAHRKTPGNQCWLWACSQSATQ